MFVNSIINEFWFSLPLLAMPCLIIYLLLMSILNIKLTPFFGYATITPSLCRSILILNSIYICIHINYALNSPLKVTLFGGCFEINEWANLIGLLTLIFLNLYIILYKFYAPKTLDFEMLILIYFSTFGLYLICFVSDFIVFFICLELFSLPTYILISSKVYSPKSTEAGLKYFMLGGFFSAILAFGISCIYYTTGSTNFYALEELLLINWKGAIDILTLGILLITINFLFKISIVPFHFATPDAYEGAPLIITTYINVFPKLPLFSTYFNIYHKCFYNYTNIYTPIIIATGLLTIIWSAFALLTQFKIKRILAYSTIFNTGFFVVSFGVFDIFSMASMFVYQFVYCVIMFGFFYCLVCLRTLPSLKFYDKTSSLINLSRSNFGLAIVMMVFLFSLGSIPPVSGFFGKYVFFLGILDVNLVVVSLVIVLASILPLIVYLRMLKLVFFSGDDLAWNTYVNVPFPTAMVLSLVFIFNLIIFLVPNLHSAFQLALLLSL